MRKAILLMMVFALICSAALACSGDVLGDWLQVVDCKEYITLRAEPSTDAEETGRIPLNGIAVYLQSAGNDFARVLYNGQTGYARKDYLKNMSVVCESCLPQNLNDQELCNLQIFLSNFTEQGMGHPAAVLQGSSMTDAQLVDFAIEHIWYNRQDKLEWGEYANGNNVRLSSEHIPEVCLKYFGRVPEELSPSLHDYEGGCYYWQETGGHVPYGFAAVTEAKDMGGGRYRVDFEVHGMGMAWDGDVHAMSLQALAEKRPELCTDDAPRGNAVIDVGNGSLMDRSTWTLDRLVMDWGM